MDTAIANDTDAIVRYVYFDELMAGNPQLAGNRQFDGPKVYYPSDEGFPASSNSVLAPGEFAVIGSAGKKTGSEFTTYFGRISTEASRGPMASTSLSVDMMQQVVLDPVAGQVTWHPDGSSGTPVGDIAIAIDTNPVHGTRSLGISDPVDNEYEDLVMASGAMLEQGVSDGVGIVDGGGMDFPLDEPLDQQVLGADWPGHPLNRRGLVPGYRLVLLQRLADPTSAFDVLVNPYRTVDSSAVDLFVFNGLMTEADQETARTEGTGVTDQDTSLPDALGTFERDESQTAPDPEVGVLLWRTSVLGEFDAASEAGAAGTVLPFEFVNSLGRINEYTTANIGMNTYPWLTWNNRPFANRFELVNVPYTSPGWLTRLFSIPASVTGTVDAFSASDYSGAGLEGTTATAGMPFASLAGMEQNKLKEVVHPNAFGFAHLLNFSADADTSDRLAPVMDFVEVPSRFAGTFEYVDTTVFDLSLIHI